MKKLEVVETPRASPWHLFHFSLPFPLRSTEIHNSSTTLNQQNREYYFLRFSEVQKELSGMKAKLGKIE